MRRIVSREDHVAKAKARNVQLGPPFQSIAEIRTCPGEVLARLVRPQALAGGQQDARWHPAVLDACLQACGYLTEDDETWVPAAIDEVISWAPAPDEFWCRASVSGTQAEGTLRADLECADRNGTPLLSIRGAVFRRLQDAGEFRTEQTRSAEHWFYSTAWEHVAIPEQHASRRIRLSGGPPEFIDQLKAALENRGSKIASTNDAASDAIVFLDPLSWGGRWPAFQMSLQSLRTTLRTLSDLPEAQQAELWFITCTAQKVHPTDQPDELQAGWSGMCSTLAPEISRLRVRRVDLDSLAGPSASALAGLLGVNSRIEDEWALRGDRWYSPRLRRVSIRPAAWRPHADALYLITGGTGGIGMALAEDLASRGARHLALAARRPPARDAGARIDGLGRNGVRVHALQADLSSENSVRNLVDYCRRAGTPLRGIFHAAGVVRDGLFQHLEDEQWDAVWSAKVNGAVYLDRFTDDLELNCFVLFSSICSYMGAAGQANYAAANAALDALAHKRKSRGRAALSVNWGAWSDAGMAAAMGEFGKQRLDQLGLQPMTPREGCRALSYAMSSDAANLTVLPPVKWPRLLEKLHAGRVPSRLRPFVEYASSTVPSATEPQFENDNPDEVLRTLQKMAAGILGSNGRLPEPDRPLLSVGFDSLTAMEMRSGLLKTMGTNLPVSSFLTGVTLRDLASLCSSATAARQERELFEV
jgi:NAD(P)-dependent dehydrogenase (short-subunit alcohol dehydrogenase family)